MQSYAFSCDLPKYLARISHSRADAFLKFADKTLRENRVKFTNLQFAFK